MKLIQATGPTLRGQKPKGRKHSTRSLGKGELKQNKFKYIYICHEKVEKYYTNEGAN